MAENITYGEDQQIRIALMKDIQEGRSPFFMLNRLLDYISEKSGESTFAQIAKENIRSVYGIGLGEPELLQAELQEAQQREEKLQSAYQSESSEVHKKRIEYAITAHQNRIQELQLRLSSANQPQ